MITGEIAGLKDITPNEKRVLAFIMRAEQGQPLAAAYISKALSLSRTQIVQSINKLLQQNYIVQSARRRIGYIYEIIFQGESPKNFFLLLSSGDCGYKRSRMTSLEMMVLAHMQLRQGQNTKMWWRQRCIAEDLGSTQQRISRATISLEAKGYIKADRVNGGAGQNNQYQVSVAAPLRVFERPELSTTSESRTQYRAQIDKHIEIKNSDNTAASRPQKGAANAACFNAPQAALSGSASLDQVTERYRLLLRQGIDQTTAEFIAKDARISTKSLQNVINNAYVKENESGGLWKARPGYYITAINTAITEGKQISLTQKASEMSTQKDAALAFANSQKRLSDLRKARKAPQTHNLSFAAQLSAKLSGQGGFYSRAVEGAAI